MGLQKTHQLLNLPATVDNTQMIIWIDDQLIGYTSNSKRFNNIIDNILKIIDEQTKTEYPNYLIEHKIDGNIIKIKCKNVGYVYTSTFTAHTLKIEPIYRINVC
jgi:hypothetical protein